VKQKVEKYRDETHMR